MCVCVCARRVYRAGEVTEKEATWTFKLVHVNPDYRSYLFSASSEKEMASWMAMLKQEMLRASGKLHRSVCCWRIGLVTSSVLSLFSSSSSSSSSSFFLLFFSFFFFFFFFFLPLLFLLLLAPMGSPSRGGGVSRLSLPTPFSPIFVCPSAYRNLSPVLLFTHQLLPTYLQFSSSDCPFCLHRPFTYISLLYKPSFCHFSFSLWSTRDPAR